MSRARLAVRSLGELMVTLGVVLLLFASYQLFWTNVEAHAAADQVTADIRADWDRPKPSAGPRAFEEGRGFAFLHIPRLGQGFEVPIVEGTALDLLKSGVGHYTDTAAPGAVGNFAVAGHRATNGEPFRALDQLRPGDPVVVETREAWFVYRVDSSEIVEPTRVSVLLPVPEQPGVAPTEARITLTTCNPRWASYERLIVYGTLAQTVPRAGGPPAVLEEG